MILALFRHGPAVPSGTAGLSDEERPLTSEGRKKTRSAARGVRALDLGLDAVFTSPLPRALETAEILADVLGLPGPTPDDRLLPDVAPLRLLELVRDVGADTPVLVGHEPALSGALAWLVGAPNAAEFEMKKAGLAVVRLRKLGPRPTGTLTALLKPSTLRELGR